MNYLGHTYLSGNNNEVIIGNFIGDAVKGRNYMNYQENIQRGIILHRTIDSYTDQHPVFKESKRKLNSHYKLFSGVVIDIFYDHFISKYWNNYSVIPRKLFVQNTYSLLLKNFAILPEKVKYFLPYMIKNNWLELYSNIDGIHRVLTGLSKWTSLPEQADFAIDTLSNYYEEFHDEFDVFIKDIYHFIEKEKKIELTFHHSNL